MRVALVVPAFPQVSETFIVSKAVGLVDRGIDVQIVASSSPSANWEAFGPRHRVHELRNRVHVAFTSTLQPSVLGAAATQMVRLAKGRRRLRSYLAHVDSSLMRSAKSLLLDAALIELGPDIVHFEFGSLAPARMYLKESIGAAVTVSFRGYDLNYVALADPGFYSGVWAHADRVHVLGDDLWRRALRRGANESVPHSVISPAIDTRDVIPGRARPGLLGSTGNPLRVLSVGRLHWKKGYDYALEAIGRLVSRGIHVEYRIIGDGDLLAAVAFWRHQLGLDERVSLLRAVPPAVVAEQLGWADVLLHAATSEGFCNAVIEAQAHGVPVVCSDADGLGENVEDGVTGFVVPRRDPDALADRLIILAREESVRSRMNAAGPERVAQKFRIEDQLDAWQDFYREALSHHRSNPGRTG